MIVEYKLATAPSGQVITTAEMKAHLRVEHSDEDSLIDFLLSAAVDSLEKRMNLKLLTQSWKAYLDYFPTGSSYYYPPLVCSDLFYRSASDDVIRLEMAPISAVSSVKYTDLDGVTQTLVADTDYMVDLVSIHPRIAPAYSKSWPSAKPIFNSVEIAFSVGYGTASNVPNSIKQAIKLLVAAWYAVRESIVIGMSVDNLPRPAGFEALVWQNKVKSY